MIMSSFWKPCCDGGLVRSKCRQSFPLFDAFWAGWRNSNMTYWSLGFHRTTGHRGWWLFEQSGLPEPWLVITHAIWTTQEDAIFITDRIGTVVDARWCDETFWGTPSSVKASKNQGSGNPNCLNFLKDAHKVYQGISPTYWHWFDLIFCISRKAWAFKSSLLAGFFFLSSCQFFSLSEKGREYGMHEPYCTRCIDELNGALNNGNLEYFRVLTWAYFLVNEPAKSSQTSKTEKDKACAVSTTRRISFVSTSPLQTRLLSSFRCRFQSDASFMSVLGI